MEILSLDKRKIQKHALCSSLKLQLDLLPGTWDTSLRINLVKVPLETVGLSRIGSRAARKGEDLVLIWASVSRRSRIAYVEFKSIELVPKAIALSGTIVMGLPIMIQLTEAERNRTHASDMLVMIVLYWYRLIESRIHTGGVASRGAMYCTSYSHLLGR